MTMSTGKQMTRARACERERKKGFLRFLPGKKKTTHNINVGKIKNEIGLTFRKTKREIIK